MNNRVEVIIDGKIDNVTIGTTLYELSKKEKKDLPIVAALIDGKLSSLNEKISKRSNIKFLDISNKQANRIYINGLYFILIKALKDIIGKNKKLIIEHSIDKGTYCEIKELLSEDIVLKIKKRMQEIVKSNLKFNKVIVERKDAKEYYEKNEMDDKLELLNVITSDTITLYKLGNIYDYFYTLMPYSTEALTMFELNYIKPCGIVLTYPTIENPNEIKKYSHPEKIFEVFREYTAWANTLNIATVADLNKAIANGEGDEIISISETMQNRKIGFVADQIKERKDKLKLILIAGPSSSGKTTTSKKLSIHLKTLGIIPKNLSIDDYYINRVDTPKTEEGNYDYESINAIDTKLFNEHIKKLIEGEEVTTPKYNFIKGEKEFNNANKMKLKRNEVLIIEGIHGHNEKLTKDIENDKKYKIYISPLTQLNLDNHNRIHTTDTRLLRRMIRDYKYRGYKPEQTIKDWKEVRSGEEKWIFPHQNDADIILNSALLYEIAVLKPFAEPLLYSVPKDKEEYIEAVRLIYFLRNFLPLSSESIPKDSHLREFIGGSSFRKEI